MKKSRYSIVVTTVDSMAAARALARTVLKSRLAACAQFWPINSLYWWNGKIDGSREVFIQFKTRREAVRKLLDWIKSSHAYEVPEIIAVPVESGCSAYLKWITAEATGVTTKLAQPPQEPRAGQGGRSKPRRP